MAPFLSRLIPLIASSRKCRQTRREMKPDPDHAVRDRLLIEQSQDPSHISPKKVQSSQQTIACLSPEIRPLYVVEGDK